MRTTRSQGVGALLLVMSSTPALATTAVDWDQVANIKEAAVRLGNVQRKQGATKAFEFIIACYKTHGMATKYTRFFEGCIAQDYIHTQTLATIYSRMPPAALKKARAPSPQVLAQAMGQRVTGAFSKYDVTPAEASAFKKLVDKHGFTPFAEIVFPKAKRNKGGAPGGAMPEEAAPPNDSNGNEQKKDSP
ncbi:MAG: hypothetical protein Q7T86_10160 [Hyphomicrobiaceae bacterium]|nr:hypothetical protein [Hyphomicrobiaceae bacterium]